MNQDQGQTDLSRQAQGQVLKYYWVSKMQPGFDVNYGNGYSKYGGQKSGSGYGEVGKELLHGTAKNDRFSNWNEIQKYFQEHSQPGSSNPHLPLPPLVVTIPSKGKPPRLPPQVIFPPVYPPYLPWPGYLTTAVPPMRPFPPPTEYVPVRINPTTAPILGAVTTTTGFPSNITLPTTAPVQSVVTQHGPLYDIPYDLYQYLLRNLPRNVNDVHSLPYPVYVLLYLLRQSGIDLSTIPNLNITGLNISSLPPILGDLPGGNYSLG